MLLCTELGVSLLHSHSVMGHMFLCCLARGHTWKLWSNKSIFDCECVLFTYLFIPTTSLQYWLSQDDAAAFLKAFLEIRGLGHTSRNPSGEIQTAFHMEQHLVFTILLSSPFSFLLLVCYFCQFTEPFFLRLSLRIFLSFFPPFSLSLSPSLLQFAV